MSATALTTTDVLDLCQQMLQRAGLSVAQLAKHAGKDLPMVETPPPKQPGQLAPRVAQTLAALDRLEGATLAELQDLLGGISLNTVFGYVDQLLKLGLVTRVKVPGIRAARFFRDAAHGQRWADQQAAAMLANPPRPPAPAPAPRSSPTLTDIGQPVKSSAPLPTVPPPAALSKASDPASKGGQLIKRDQPAQVPAGLVPTRVPAAVDTRFTVAPGEPLTGGFSTSKPGINPLTGRAWGV